MLYGAGQTELSFFLYAIDCCKVRADQHSLVRLENFKTCRIVLEWTFQRDGVNIGMKYLSNQTRGAQL